MLFIKKKDSSLWLVQDYKTLNTVIVKNQYFLPLISDLVSKLQDAWYFTKLDVHWGFNNVHINSGDEWKAVFYTNCSLFKLLVIFFGMINSPIIFQTMMNDIFQNLLADRIIIVYLDNILIFTQTLENHQKAICKVLKVLAKHKLFLCPRKCEFITNKILTSCDTGAE